MGIGLLAGRCCFVVMILRKEVEWLNVQLGPVRLRREINKGYLYVFFAILFMSHLTTLSISAT